MSTPCPYSQDQIDTINSCKYNLTELSEMLGISYGSLSHYRRTRGLKLPYKSPSNSKVKNEDFFQSWSPNMAYCVGFLLADGCLMYRQQTYSINISLATKDEDHIYKLANLMQCSQSIHRENSKKQDHHLSKITICNKKMFNDLVNIGITPRKTLTLKWIGLCFTECQSHLVRGILDGDGCINISKRKEGECQHLQVTFVGTESVLSGIKRCFYEYSGKSIGTIYKIKDKNAYRYVMAGNRNCIRFLDWIYTNSDSSNRMDRKYIIYQKFLGDYMNNPRNHNFLSKYNLYSSSHTHLSHISPHSSQYPSSSVHSPQQSISPQFEQ